MIEATYISVMRDGSMWFQPAIVDAQLNIVWRGDVLVRTPRRAIKLARVAL